MMGYLSAYDEKSKVLTVIVPEFYDLDIINKQSISECEVTLRDGRSISPKQNRAIFAMIRDIASWVSGFSEKETVRNETLHTLQMAYLMDSDDTDEIRYAITDYYCGLKDIEWFSLSAKSSNAASMTLARDFLTFLIDFAIENGVPCSSRLIDRAEDIGRYLYACLVNRVCCVCGKPLSDTHHCDSVGMGRDREHIVHEGLLAMALCREHHNEAHTIGQETFEKKYKVFGIALDKNLCEILRLKTNT